MVQEDQRFLLLLLNVLKIAQLAALLTFLTRVAANEPSGFEVMYEHRPLNYALVVLVFLDALLAIHYACGHHLIALNGALSAAFTRQAVSCTGSYLAHEESKIRMEKRGAFDEGGDVWSQDY